MVKRCLFCGRYFTPDHRVKERQKACNHPDCRKTRKKKAQEAWVEKNPGYFQGRYPYVKAWRQEKKMIQDEMDPICAFAVDCIHGRRNPKAQGQAPP